MLFNVYNLLTILSDKTKDYIIVATKDDPKSFDLPKGCDYVIESIDDQEYRLVKESEVMAIR